MLFRSAGELEHSAALMHPTFGGPIRKAVHGGKVIIPSTKKVGGPGTHIDIPFFYKDEIYVMSHLDAMEVGLCDAPKSNEILLALAMTTGGDRKSGVEGKGVDIGGRRTSQKQRHKQNRH